MEKKMLTGKIISWFKNMTFWKAFFLITMAFGGYSTFIRFVYGLGSATHLSDKFPWGLWIGFDVLCGVGLAAGGFVIAATVYIFHLDNYRSLLHPAILTAFLGYLLVIVALIYDLGRPWNIWHPLIMWNPHSVMFEVGWCVILYTTVLALEFSPIVFERFRLTKAQRIIHAVTVPLVVVGVMLSSLHQSSLGSLYLIVPEKMYPLWYSSNLPYLFFLSAVAVGPAMVTIESYLSSRAFNREIELVVLNKLGKVTVVALSVYLVIKIEDIVNNNLFNYLITFNMEGILFWAEIVIGVMVPVILLSNSRIRMNKNWLFYTSIMVVTGFVLNRMNVSITSLEKFYHASYFPKWTEISITLMIVAIGFAAFKFIAQHFPVFPEHEESRQSQ
ncbi:MAG: NrfD/PsrC family molybdoenzyme membrane anchor subunit, partial [Candidatus Kryptoniota bacterium]